jgi:hypothetical protein
MILLTMVGSILDVTKDTPSNTPSKSRATTKGLHLRCGNFNRWTSPELNKLTLLQFSVCLLTVMRNAVSGRGLIIP